MIKLRILIATLIFASIQGESLMQPNSVEDALNISKKYLPSNPIILDAGAFDGKEITTMMEYWPSCTVHAFEPVPSIFNRLISKYKDHKNIKCYQLALSEKTEDKIFYLSNHPDTPNHVWPSSSLLPPKEHLNYSKIEFNGTIKVQSLNMDDWANKFKIDNVDMLWLDLQGYELPVIKHAPNIMKTVKVVYTEVEFVEAYEGQALYDDIKEWMKKNGFELVARDFKLPLESHVWFANALFVRKDLLKK